MLLSGWLQAVWAGSLVAWEQRQAGTRRTQGECLCFLATGQRALGPVWGSMVLFFVGKWILGASLVGGTFLP